jgi:hypothetical protein
MVDIVYTLADTSVNDYMELRYSLRSLELHGVNYRKVVIVGGLPTWLDRTQITHISEEDRFFKDRNIMVKLMAAANSNKVTADFWHFNDDYFLLKTYDFKTLKSCKHERNLYNYVWEVGRENTRWNKYTRIVENTWKILNSRELPIEFYDVHLPFKYNSKKFQDAMQKYDWNCPFKMGYVVRSLYGNTIGMKAETITNDVKMSNLSTVEGAIRYLEKDEYPMFSSGERDRHNLVRILEKLYPQKSKYEI